jgi:hypothetical protein
VNDYFIFLCWFDLRTYPMIKNKLSYVFSCYFVSSLAGWVYDDLLLAGVWVVGLVGVER